MYTVTELDDLCRQVIDELNVEIVAYDERAAIAAEGREAKIGNKSTTNLALEALQRPERFCGHHDVARAWLRENARAGGKQSA